jgi:superfamily II DNA or RNA helicase
MTQKRFFASNTAYQTISDTLHNATDIRIATAYFEPSGYQVLKPVLAGKSLRLLVGRNEGGRDRVIEVLQEFENALTDAPLDQRMQSMRQMLSALENGFLQVNVINSADESIQMDARYLYHHAKLYIADTSAVVVTSANMSYHGLKTSREAGYVVENLEDVLYFVDRFDELFEQAESITQELIDKLLGLVGAHSPFEVYVRALMELYRLPDETVPQELPVLAEYQKPVVARVLQSLLDYKGAMLIASTGLGKTVMTAHIVAYLNMERRIDRVIVVSPAGLRDQWRRYMRMAAISSREFSYSNLSSDSKKSPMARNLDYELKHLTETTLIILDESHHMRNKDAKDNENKIRFQRVYNAVRNQKAQLLMLTATPFSRDIQDINNQLRLLPLPEFSTLNLNHRKSASWEIQSVTELPELAPCAVLTTPSVVSRFSYDDEKGEKFVVFGHDDKRYFPRRLKFHTESYANPLDDLLSDLLQSGLLNQIEDSGASLFGDEFVSMGRKAGFFNAEVMKQFCSLPVRVETLFNQLADGETGFEKIRFARQEELTNFVQQKLSLVQRHKSVENDPKLKRIFEIIENAQIGKKRKIIIFCHYIKSTKFLTELINEHLFNVKVCADTNAQRDPEQVDRIIKRFAPIANDSESEGFDEAVQVLVATGALAEGFNLQDASILINSDMSWTVLTLAQRLGRILRPWREPREIDIYNFMPSTMQDERISLAVNWHNRLKERNRQHQSFADIPVLLDDGDTADEEIEMQELARERRIFDHETTLDLNQTLEFINKAQKITTSSFWDDLTRISIEERNRVENLPFGFRSVRQIKNGKKRLFILFLSKRRYYPVLFDKDSRVLLDSEERDTIMNTIRCDPSEPTATYIEDDEFDKWLDKCRENWIAKNNIAMHEKVQIVCALALVNV